MFTNFYNEGGTIYEKRSKIYTLGISLASLIKKMNKTNNIYQNEELLQGIVKHNKYRYYVLDSVPTDEDYHIDNNDIPDDYISLKYDLEAIVKSKVALSFSTNKIRQDYLHEEFPVKYNYHISKLRYDKFNGYQNSCKVYNALLNLFNVYKDCACYHYIIAPYHNTLFNMTSLNFNTLKSMNRNISYTKRLNDVIGYIIKYELCWSIYKSKLCINPHCHILFFMQNENREDIISSIDEYYTSYYNNYKDTYYRLVEHTNIDINNICNYIAKDPYDKIFKSDTPIKPEYIDVIAQLSQIRNLHFYNSYKEFKNIFKTEE